MLRQHAIRQLMAHAAGAGSLQAVYQTALRGVQEALDVERASLLVFDAGGTMRFVVWSGLSDAYRAAADGHSPWAADEAAAAPLLVPDVEDDPGLRPLIADLRREEIRALAFVPVQFGTRLLGKFMLYYRAPHTFTDAEIALAQQIADDVAFALEHHRVAVALEGRVAAEHALREEAETEAARREAGERRLSVAMAAGHMGAWEWDIPSGRVSWSSELEIIHGLEPGSFEGTVEAVRREVYPADADRLSGAIGAALASPESGYRVDYRIQRPDGTLRWVGATGRVIVGADGQPARMVGICRDVTARKRAKEASEFLAAASRVLATTLSPDAILRQLARFVVPRLADWCLVQVIDQTGQLQPVEVVHQDAGLAERLRAVIRRAPSLPRQFESAADVVARGRPSLLPHITDDMLVARAEGDGDLLQFLREMRCCSVITVPLQARGRTLGALSLMSAESGRHYDEADLRFAEEMGSWAALALDNAELYRQAQEARLAAETARGQLEALARVGDQIAVSLDPDEALRELAALAVPAFADYCVTYAARDGVIQRLGAAHRDPARTPALEAAFGPAPLRLDDRDGPARVIREGVPMLVSDLPVHLFQAHSIAGSGFELRSIMTVPLNARGRTLGAIVFAAAADSGRRFDDADLQIAMELAGRAAMLIDNARLYAEARSAVGARDEMIAVVSHDLRDPLQAIAAAAAALRLEPQTAENAETIESIALASTQMRRLVQDLLDISMIEAGCLPLDPERVDLPALLLEAQRLLLPLVRAKSVRIEMRLAANLPPVPVDRHRILQVLVNLMSNALKFGPAGGLVTVGAERDPGGIRVWVQDTGAGIGPEHVDRVFERFWRVDRSAGAGLGLAVAKGIVDAHGGRIGVTSEPGAGCTFFFTLPLQSVAATGAGPTRARVLVPQAGLP
jgi:PAS domain S-box-containing protein